MRSVTRPVGRACQIPSLLGLLDRRIH